MRTPHHRIRLWLLGLVAVCAVTPAAAQTPAEVEKRIQDQTEALVRAKAAADAKAIRAFDRMIRIAREDKGITEIARKDLLDKCTAFKAQFQKTAQWPTDPVYGLDDDEWTYLREVGQAYRQLAQANEVALRVYRNAKDDAAADRVLATRASLIGLYFPANRAWAEGSQWEGQLKLAKRSPTVRLRITEVGEGTFKAVVHHNATELNHPIFEVTGTIDGPLLHFTVLSANSWV